MNPNSDQKCRIKNVPTKLIFPIFQCLSLTRNNSH
ncbi:hypothetical protein MHIR_DE00273 [Candidatus Doolittlea endobia]|uniref:Uncharacterized protein n=1 Tax=Candidatus Doolittlea endobia TaxID=1778262 RepID=A0A143WSS8_9ENTR|nr:hypothetical protein MHIR_DE00273 [Candidatus Doolittlea endobia]